MSPLIAADGGALVPGLLVLGIIIIAAGVAVLRKRPPRRAVRHAGHRPPDVGHHQASPASPLRPLAVPQRPSLSPPAAVPPVRAEESETVAPSLEVPITVRVETSVARAIEKPDSGPLTAAGDGAWVLNPRSSLPLTLTGTDEATAAEVKALLETVYGRGTHEVEEGLVAILARSNARCREIDQYVAKYKPLYLKAIKSRIESSGEWAGASELDREDILSQCKQEAIDTLDVRPYDGVEELFDKEPSDFTLDDRLLERYGYEPLRLYLQYRGRARRVLRIAADHYHRKGFEWLVQVGLACRGSEVATEDLLDGVTIKEMRELTSDLAPPTFSRKAKAIAYFAALPDARDRLGKVIAFREVFQLRPLPTEFAEIDLDRVAETWQYTRAVANLIVHTYLMGAYSTRSAESHSGIDDFVSAWEIIGANENSCPFCRRAAAKKYPKARPPRVPLHIGCRCSASPVTKSWDDLIADASGESS